MLMDIKSDPTSVPWEGAALKQGTACQGGVQWGLGPGISKVAEKA
jgi:hypothetical protein